MNNNNSYHSIENTVFNSIHLALSLFLALIFILFYFIYYFPHYNDYIITVFSIQRDYISLDCHTIPGGKLFFMKSQQK